MKRFGCRAQVLKLHCQNETSAPRVSMGTTNDTLLPFEHKSTDYQGYKEKIYLTTKSGIYLTEIGVA
ncbi:MULTISPECIES: hypothetical protein [Segatella]|uniref:hypothetical protein n=1 Tax=Segatella TaxID=2974251 RepID=UPI00115F9BBC|nr:MULTISPECIES: hypothetical protein [Segatella]UKK77358.1 hypothetical protein L6469_06095 [Segatella baroniae B14]